MIDGQEVLMGDSALSDEATRRLEQIKTADIVIGIPSHRNGRTIGEVVEAVRDAVRRYLPDKRVVLMNADGGSSDNTVKHVEDAEMPANVEKVLTLYEGAIGKGTAVHAILEATVMLGARACLILEARAPGITPEWIPAMVEPVLHGAEIVIPCFASSASAAAINDNLVYPFMRTFIRTDLRGPLISEFCVSGSLARDLILADIWETDVSRFGINVWVPLQGLAEGRQMVQVDLGYRGEPGGEPGAVADPRLLHVIGTMLRVLVEGRRLWQKEPVPRLVGFVGPRCADRAVPCNDCRHELLMGFREGAERYGALWEQILQPALLAEVRVLEGRAEDDIALDKATWAHIVMDFAVIFNQGEGDPDKVVEALLPLLYLRCATYLRETEGMTPGERGRTG
jgi:hypothetical protein